ncbi:disulfide bond formation protein DsbB [Candidatus Blochmannia ocreatus (nom. nud.)]|uniref:Disulfide bond formation protein B n=1 Tax=Candidatus Blochmannia ocreatus (nom. nud.) TaxID=251538 RepID=A0ABY4SUC0_9ENTR|nr:disulfide bond formation protein DsbB [Candidatus Blochmannia ocreatus]URJ24937.1 disulfide bond formation protein DsbB [Candidatus Blochmannia ocreatus]
MLLFLRNCSKIRKYWFLLILTIITLELTALYLQHISIFIPCILCIYQRCALGGIGIAGIIAIISPKIYIIRMLAVCIWIYSAWKGFLLAKEQINIQSNPSPFLTCDLFVQFPNWIPLNKWWPNVFEGQGDCATNTQHFLFLEISQWMIIIFTSYLLISILIFLSHILHTKKRKNPLL